MFWLKACPKCQGDLFRHSDIYGTYLACLQCARHLTEAELATLQRTSVSISPQPADTDQFAKLAA